MNKKKISIFLLLVIVVCITVFTILHEQHGGSLFPTPEVQRQTRYFSQDTLYVALHDFMRLDDGVIQSTSEDPWILLHLDPDIPGHILQIHISDLSSAETYAQVFFASYEWGFTETGVVSFLLRNGINKVMLPRSDNAALRLDLTSTYGVSMIVDGVTLSNYTVLPMQFWVQFSVTVLIIVTILSLLLFKTGFVMRLLRRFVPEAPSTSDTLLDKKLLPSFKHLRKLNLLITLLSTIALHIVPLMQVFVFDSASEESRTLFMFNLALIALFSLIIYGVAVIYCKLPDRFSTALITAFCVSALFTGDGFIRDDVSVFLSVWLTVLFLFVAINSEAVKKLIATLGLTVVLLAGLIMHPWFAALIIMISVVALLYFLVYRTWVITPWVFYPALALFLVIAGVTGTSFSPSQLVQYGLSPFALVYTITTNVIALFVHTHGLAVITFIIFAIILCRVIKRRFIMRIQSDENIGLPRDQWVIMLVFAGSVILSLSGAYFDIRGVLFPFFGPLLMTTFGFMYSSMNIEKIINMCFVAIGVFTVTYIYFIFGVMQVAYGYPRYGHIVFSDAFLSPFSGGEPDLYTTFVVTIGFFAVLYFALRTQKPLLMSIPVYAFVLSIAVSFAVAPAFAIDYTEEFDVVLEIVDPRAAYLVELDDITDQDSNLIISEINVSWLAPGDSLSGPAFVLPAGYYELTIIGHGLTYADFKLWHDYVESYPVELDGVTTYDYSVSFSFLLDYYIDFLQVIAVNDGPGFVRIDDFELRIRW